jgi:hypothetical protein
MRCFYNIPYSLGSKFRIKFLLGENFAKIGSILYNSTFSPKELNFILHILLRGLIPLRLMLVASYKGHGWVSSVSYQLLFLRRGGVGNGHICV